MNREKLLAKKLVGSITTSKLFKSVKDEIISYDRFISGDLRVIGLPEYLHSDCTVKSQFSFSDWLENYQQWPVIKVEGLETIDSVRSPFRKFNPLDIHLFVSQKTGYSFKWHKDCVDVFLYVLKGKKTVQVKDKTYIVTAGSGVFIPKNHLHRVFSIKNTWALSIGY